MKNLTNHSRRAPITAAERRQIEADARDIWGAAKRKQVTLDAFEYRDEKAAADLHFELGCWLFYYSSRIYETNGLDHRINCARLLFEAGINSPGYQFFTVFNFGERHFDTLFEMGDAEQVREALRPIAASNPVVAKAFDHLGWSLISNQASLSF